MADEGSLRRVYKGVRFDPNEPVMFANGRITKYRKDAESPEKEKKETKKEEEFHRVQRENELLKRRLSRRWSSRSSFRGSVTSKVIDKAIQEEEDDDSMLLLRKKPNFRMALLKTEIQENGTLHGLRDLMSTTSNQLRVIWIFLLCIASLLTFHGVWQIIQEYQLRRVVVSYFIQESTSLSLPDIVICPFNRFNRSYLEHWNVSAGLAQYMELSYPSPVIHAFQERTYDETLQNIDQYEYELELLLDKVGNMSYTRFLKEASLSCDVFFKEKERCENLTEIMTSAGKCFRLEGQDQTTGGFGYGERIVVTLPQHLYNPGSNQMLNDGIAIKLASRGKGIDNDLTFIPSGVHAIVPLTATRYEFMNDPPRYECEMDPDGTYSRVWCYEICLTQKAEDMCNCSLAAATRPRKDAICTTKQFYHCFVPYLFPDNHTSIVETCKAKCKAPCTYWQYQKAVSYATFPGQTAKYFVANQSEWDELKSTIILEMYFADLDYTMIKHVVAMPLQSVIAQIGGQFSLWAGGSLISLCQIIIYLLRYLYYKFRRRNSRARIAEPPSKFDSVEKGPISEYSEKSNDIKIIDAPPKQL